MTNRTSREAYEHTLVVTVFAVFFPITFTNLNDYFIPSEAIPLEWATPVSVIAIVTFSGFSFLVVFYYLHLFYGNKLKVTWKPKCRFIRDFVWNSGRRTLAVGGAPLGLFYGAAFFLYSAFRKAFEAGEVQFAHSYTWASFGYFSIWAMAYIAESYFGIKRPRGRKRPCLQTVLSIVAYFVFSLIVVVLTQARILNPR